MHDFLELGFNWLDVGKTGTLSYGWSTTDDGGWSKRLGTSDTVDPDHPFSFILAETSETTDLTLVQYSIEFKRKTGNPYFPISNNGWQEQGVAQRFESGSQPLAFSPRESNYLPGLDQDGYYIFLPVSSGPPTNTVLDFVSVLKSQRNAQHPYEVTISITAAKGEETGTWAVDPELIIGGRG